MIEGDKQHLTDEEIAEIRRILDEERKMKWLWSVVRKWAAWIAGVAGMLVAFRDDISRLLGGGP